MAATTKKAAPKKGKALESKTGAGAAIAERSKDAKKPAFGKAAPKTVKPTAQKSAAAKPAKPAAPNREVDPPCQMGAVVRVVRAPKYRPKPPGRTALAIFLAETHLRRRQPCTR